MYALYLLYKRFTKPKAEEELKKAFKDEKGRTQTFFSDITIQNASEWTGDAYPPRPSIFGFLKRE